MRDSGINQGLVQKFDTTNINTQKAFFGFRKMFRDYLNKLNVGFYDSCCKESSDKIPVFYNKATGKVNYIDPADGLTKVVG